MRLACNSRIDSIDLIENAVEGCMYEREYQHKQVIAIHYRKKYLVRYDPSFFQRRLTTFDVLRLSEVAFPRCLSRKPIMHYK